jgi:hypothetical protein
MLGGPAPNAVRPLIGQARKAVREDQINLERLENQLFAANEALERAVDAIVEPPSDGVASTEQGASPGKQGD